MPEKTTEGMLPSRDIVIRYGLQLFAEENGINFFPYDCLAYSVVKEKWNESVPLISEDDAYAKGRAAIEAQITESNAQEATNG